MSNVTIRKNDQIMMSLVHYFVTKEDYAPINVQGVKDEIWLENLNGPYRIIRISSNSIINEEQYKFDIFKVKHIMKQIKKKTLSFKINALNICLDMSKKVDIPDTKNISTVKIDSMKDLKKNEEITSAFPNIESNLIKSTDGLELLINVTNDINEKTAKENDKFNHVFAPKRIIITNILIIISLIMYVIMCIYGSSFFDINPNILAKFGANNILLVKNGEYYRLFTSAFLHVGIIHLLVNMYSLKIIGSQVENFIGKTKFIFVYIISALSGSLMSLIFLKPNVVACGASGALFGLMGCLLYFGYHYRLYLSDAIKNQIIPIIIINLFIGFSISGIDNACHIGGLIGGYLSTMAVGIKDKSTKQDRINGIIVLTLYLLFLSYIVFFVK